MSRIQIGGRPGADLDSKPQYEPYIPGRDAVRQLQERIAAFEATLDAEHEVGISLHSFRIPGSARLVEITAQGQEFVWLSFDSPTSTRIEQLLHFSQLNIVLEPVPKLGTTARRMMGFNRNDES